MIYIIALLLGIWALITSFLVIGLQKRVNDLEDRIGNVERTHNAEKDATG
jgi:hypothetical protein